MVVLYVSKQITDRGNVKDIARAENMFLVLAHPNDIEPTLVKTSPCSCKSNVT